MTDPKRPRGRPRGWRAENPRSEMLRVKVTPDELAAIDEASNTEGGTRSQFVRSAALAMARRVLKARVR